MLKNSLWILIWGLASLSGLAQNDRTLIPESYKLQVKFNATALISPQYPGLQAALEHRWVGKRTFIHELGVLRRFPNQLSTWDAQLWGYRLRTGWRWYDKGPNQNRTDFYLSTWIQFKQLFVQEERFIERFGGSFSERMNLEQTRNYAGAYCAAGWQGPMSATSRWEVDVGMGFRYRWVNSSELPDDAIDPRTQVDLNGFGAGNGLFWPDFMLVFSLDFRFNFLLK